MGVGRWDVTPFLEHPVEALIEHAKAEFAILVQGQSHSYKAAHDEYRRRSSAEAPPGFEAWYNFAVQHQSPIIENFDIVFDSVSPFLKFCGTEVNAMMAEMLESPNNELWHCVFSRGNAQSRCTHPHRTNDRHISDSLNNILANLLGIIPNLELLVNHLDEPRLLHFQTTDMPRTPNWEVITRFCDPQKIEKICLSIQTVELFDLPFVTDFFSAMDLCRDPDLTSFNLIEGLIPILSTGALSTMGDLLSPSPAYNESGFRYDGSNDIEWGKKKNNLYWACSTTGRFARDDRWQYSQRQRYVALAQNLKRQRHNYLLARAGAVHRVSSTFLNRKLREASFTNILQCNSKSCRDQRAYFDVNYWAEKDEALRSRLVFDIDGNGISGRYYKLLASRSVPLKQTILHEWHDDRLMPWVHFVPVSQSMEELPELVLYLTSTRTGQRKLSRVQDPSRDAT
ncbi:hypothetical protein BKA65DRAFT_527562 [Rhexocercosporidium sp. MPI-PUGE-AT-0058]|nr:hypothetical protein BKA65DRAFT_527562 [Rhexocercosporidium sp. MPI-PUGE-AT-0058]